jgi:hypothetical protein
MDEKNPLFEVFSSIVDCSDYKFKIWGWGWFPAGAVITMIYPPPAVQAAPILGA